MDNVKKISIPFNAWCDIQKKAAELKIDITPYENVKKYGKLQFDLQMMILGIKTSLYDVEYYM